MLRNITLLFTILFALYLGVHYFAAPKPAEPLPPNLGAEPPTFALPVTAADARARNLNEMPFCPTPDHVALLDIPVLRIANSYPNGGGFKWDSGTGTPDEIKFKGQRILSKSKSGTYCCGFTFAVVMRVADETGMLKGKTVAQIRQFQRDWYAATPQSREKQQIYALEKHGLGHEVKLLDAIPGDFVRLWHGGSGHSVIFVKWIIENGKKVAFEYRGTQSSTNGIGNKIEYLSDALTGRAGDFDLNRTYVGRMFITRTRQPASVVANTAVLTEADFTRSMYAAIRRIARYRAFVKTAPRPAYVLDEQRENYFVAGLGEDSAINFVRFYTLRVWKSGRVDQTGPNGEWVPLISAQLAVR